LRACLFLLWLLFVRWFVVCGEQFDKMRETDRVAIHEAMEQQTISVAKAGITTMLNCRNSVLAAANPIHGRYDDMREVGENINLMSTILSRFDCIFIVRDVREAERDREIARHVLGVHITSSLAQTTNAIQPDIPAPLLKKFVMYCRERCAPRLSEEAAALLSGQYVHIRNQVRESLANKPGEAQVVPITIRQLEAITRLAESLAKMRLSGEATIADVEEALRLFKVSTLAASQSSPMIMNAVSGGNGGGVAARDVQLAEEFLKRRIGLRVTVSTKKIVEESQIQGYSVDVIRTSIRAMIMRNEMQELHQGKILRRIR
jgi:DNA replication licensing factor MCM5